MLEAGAEFVFQGGGLVREHPPGFEDVADEYIQLAREVGLTAVDERTPSMNWKSASDMSVCRASQR